MNNTNVILMKCNSDRKVVNKNVDVIVNITDTFRIKEPCSILNPVFVLSRTTVGNNWASVNYCYIPAFKRYYFVDNITLESYNMIRFECSVDVLMSYAESILSSQQEVVRSQSLNSRLYIDPERPLQSNKIMETYQIGLFPEVTGNNYVITTSGGV